MFRLNIKAMTATAVSATALSLAVWVLKADTSAAVSPHPLFSVAAITLGETLRLNVVNLADSSVPPGPCNVAVNFVNTNGELVKTLTISVQPGTTGWATVNYLEASRAKVSTAGDQRQVLRPVLNFIPPGPCRVVSSAEVYETLSGRTSQFIAPVGILPAVPANTPAIKPD